MLKTLDFVLCAWKLQFKTLFEYKKSFAISAITMVVNDFFMVFFWYVFFNVMPKIAGWGLNETILLVGFTATAFGVYALLFAGARNFNEFVANGELDFFLLKPKNILLHVCVSKTDISAAGEFVFGWICLLISGYFSLGNFILFNALAFLSGIVFVFTFILISLPAFFIPKTDVLYHNLWNSTIHFATYPTDFFSGFVKFILVFIIPAFFITTLPVQTLTHFSWMSVLILFAFAIVFGLAVSFLFKLCLKKYESGNSIALRT